MIVTYSSSLVIIVTSGTPGTVPSAPASFSLRARNEIGRFDIASVAASQHVPENETFAFIFKVETEGQIRYFLQVQLLDFNIVLVIISSLVCSQV